MVPPSGWKNALTEATLTIAPAPCSTMCASAARVARSVLKKFICIAHSKSSSVSGEEPVQAQPHRADVVDQDVDPPVLVDRPLHELRRTVRFGEVDRDGGDAIEALERAPWCARRRRRARPRRRASS